MRRIIKSVLAAFLVFTLIFATLPITSEAAFNDLKKSGVAFNLGLGSWTAVYTKLPGVKKYQKLYAKITKFRKSGGGGSGGSSGAEYTMTIQIVFPKKMPKKVAQALSARTTGTEFIDYVDVVAVDYRTGENLITDQTEATYGHNYKEVASVQELGNGVWKKYKPQKVSWAGGEYSYYVSYAKTLKITIPAGYKYTCVGICGNHIKNYDTLVDWNQGFTEGYTVLSDTAHVKLGNKKTTAKLCHFIKLKP